MLLLAGASADVSLSSDGWRTKVVVLRGGEDPGGENKDVRLDDVWTLGVVGAIGELFRVGSSGFWIEDAAVMTFCVP